MRFSIVMDIIRKWAIATRSLKIGTPQYDVVVRIGAPICTSLLQYTKEG